MSAVQLSEICFSHGRNRVLIDCSLETRSGEYMVVLGESGCGKTTLLRLIAGLATPRSGRIRIGDSDVTDTPPRKRDVALVPQQNGLYPHLSIRESIRAGLRGRAARNVVEGRVQSAAEMVNLLAELDRKPHQLSGGQLRRAALAKAISRQSAVRLFDEPLRRLTRVNGSRSKNTSEVCIKRLAARPFT